jgi:threonine synthase
VGYATGATVLRDDGTTEQLRNPDWVAERGEEGVIALQYAYGPHLLPPSTPSNDGMWRYRALLPVQGETLYPLAIGNTPLVAPPRLRTHLDLPSLWLKDETRTPTGSNKDRATALVLEHALHSGARTASCASTGNVAVSLAMGAAAAGLQAVIFVPTTVTEAKLRLMLLAGATVFTVEEGYEAAFALSIRAARAFGWCDRNTGHNPLTLEAKKTVALEIWEQLGRQVPDVVVAPVGDGVTLSALAKGFREVRACGAIDHVPRLIGVQAEGCQPIKVAWETGGAPRAVRPTTIADGIAVGKPVNAAMVLRDVRESGGAFVTVSDDAMLRAIAVLAEKAGLLAEPAGAAAVAGTEAALAQGFIGRDEQVVVLVTGTGLKNPQYLCPDPVRHAYTVHADLDAVAQALSLG